METAIAIHKALQKCALIGASFALFGCAGLLPHGTQEAESPWRSYAEAQALFAKIIPDQTTISDLKALGIDPERTPNVALLSHADLLRKMVATSSLDVHLLAPGIQQCVASHQTCFAYEIEQTFLERKRVGNFWMDFLNFHRQVDIAGWQFDAIIVVRDNVVVYKLWSGKPNIHQVEDTRSPLGPFQGFGSSFMGH